MSGGGILADTTPLFARAAATQDFAIFRTNIHSCPKSWFRPAKSDVSDAKS